MKLTFLEGNILPTTEQAQDLNQLVKAENVLGMMLGYF